MPAQAVCSRPSEFHSRIITILPLSDRPRVLGYAGVTGGCAQGNGSQRGPEYDDTIGARSNRGPEQD